jgi:hypothetical protein
MDSLNIEPSYLLSVLAWNGPVLVLAVVGIVLGLVRRLPGRVRGLLVAGSAILLLGRLISLAWSLAVPRLLLRFDVADYGRVVTVAGIVITLIEVAGMGLVLAAALAGRRAEAPPGPPQPATPPGFGPPPGTPGYGPPPGYDPAPYGPPSGYPPPSSGT